MYFTGYVLKTGIYVGHTPDVMEIMLYNGRNILVRGPTSDSKGSLCPGVLAQFCCGHDTVDLEKDQEANTYYHLSWDWVARITNEDTVRTFFEGARILKPSTKMKSKIQQTSKNFWGFLARLLPSNKLTTG